MSEAYTKNMISTVSVIK